MSAEGGEAPQRQTFVVMTDDGFDEGDRSAMHDRHPVMRRLRYSMNEAIRSSSAPEVLLKFRDLF